MVTGRLPRHGSRHVSGAEFPDSSFFLTPRSLARCHAASAAREVRVGIWVLSVFVTPSTVVAGPKFGVFRPLHKSLALRISRRIGALSITGGSVAGVRSLGLNLMCLRCRLIRFL